MLRVWGGGATPGHREDGIMVTVGLRKEVVTVSEERQEVDTVAEPRL